MFLENAQTIIEVILILVIVAGIISSRSIVKRLSVIRETYAALNEMVANLDSSTDHVGRVFDAMKQEANRGGKRLGALVEHARNASEDLTDLQKMAHEVASSLEMDVKNADEREKALIEAIHTAQETTKKLEECLSACRSVPAAQLLHHVEETQRAMKEEAAGPIAKEKRKEIQETEQFQKKISVDARRTSDEKPVSPGFSDAVKMPVPNSMRSPRPYLQRAKNKGLFGL